MRSLHPAAVSSPLGSSSSRVWTTLDLFDRPLGSRCDIQLKEPGRVAKKKKKKKKSGQEGGPNKGCSTGRRQQGATNTHTHWEQPLMDCSPVQSESEPESALLSKYVYTNKGFISSWCALNVQGTVF